MGLDPLEFTDCLTDSPVFRTKLHEHEKELERTSKAIKSLITDGKDLLNASKRKWPGVCFLFSHRLMISVNYGNYDCYQCLFLCVFSCN